MQFGALPSRLGQHEDEDTRRTLLIDLIFSDPFAPYELKFERGDMDKALGEVARTIGLSATDVKAYASTQAAAMQRPCAHQGREGRPPPAWAPRWCSAPAPSSSPGLSVRVDRRLSPGSAARPPPTSGSRCWAAEAWRPGDSGWPEAWRSSPASGPPLGFVGVSGAALMMELGAARSRAELIKLQVAYKEVLLHNQADTAKAQLVIQDLARQLDELREQIAVERTLNDRNAHRVKELEKTIEAVETQPRLDEEAACGMSDDGLDVVLTWLDENAQDLVDQARADVAQARAVSDDLDSLEARIARIREELGEDAAQAPEPLALVGLPDLQRPAAGFAATPEWEALRAQAEQSLRSRGVDPSTVDLDALLDPEEVARIARRFIGAFTVRTHLDRYDLAIMLIAGLAAALVDWLVVNGAPDEP